MRSVALRTVAVIFLGSLFSPLVGAQQTVASFDPSPSLADVSRQLRAAHPRKPGKVFTNEDLQSISFNNGAVVSYAPSTPATVDTTKKAADDKKSGQAELDKQNDDFRKRLAEQKQAIALLQRELNVTQGEFKLQSSQYYEDAGTRLRNPQKWTEEHAKYEDQIAEKQKELDAAQQSLQNLKEAGRKAGVSPSLIDE